ncbi:MAG: tetratricopeptide repeat protein [Magnetococcus sp. DMHC-6]
MKKKYLMNSFFSIVSILIYFVTSGSAMAFFSSLNYATEDKGQTEIFSFQAPDGYDPPRAILLDATTLQVSIPGLLALPFANFDLSQSQWIKEATVREMPGVAMGIYLTLVLKEPSLGYQEYLGDLDGDKGRKYRLAIQRSSKVSMVGPVRMLEGLTLPGRDGTLVIFSYTGSGFVENSVDYATGIVRLLWQGTHLGPSWRPVAPGGLAERILVQEFPNAQVEMEVRMDGATDAVRFYRNSEAGTFIIELRPKGNKDTPNRAMEAQAILDRRKVALEKGHPDPLNRLIPIFVPDPKTKKLQGQEIDEAWYMENALQAKRDRQYAKARGYLENLEKIFPETANREVIDFEKLDLAILMNWKPGWILSELDEVLSRFPNHYRYSDYRLKQLALYNQASMFESALGILCDPNLPKDSSKVWLERAHVVMGVELQAENGWEVATQLDCILNAKERKTPYERGGSMDRDAVAEYLLNEVLQADVNHGADSAEALFLLSRLKERRGEIPESIKILDRLSESYKSYIGDHPDWLLEVGDRYFIQGRYPEALDYYARLLSYYPHNADLAPKAILQAALVRGEMGDVDAATRLYDRLQTEFPDSESAVWGGIKRLQLEPKLQAYCKNTAERDQKSGQSDIHEQLCLNLRGNKEVLIAFDKVIANTHIPAPLFEAYLSKAVLLEENGEHLEAINTLNTLLTLTSRDAIVERVNELKKKNLIAGMGKELEKGNPEAAIALAIACGNDWREEAGYAPALIQLAEALERLGLYERGVSLLKEMTTEPVALELTNIGEHLEKGSTLGLIGSEDPLQISAPGARVRLAEAQRKARLADWDGVMGLVSRIPKAILNKIQQVDQLRLMAQAEEGRGRFLQSIQALESLIDLQGMADGMDYYYYALVMYQWKGAERAMPIFKKVAEQAGNSEIQALARMRIGDILQAKGDLAAAREEFKRIAESTPENLWSKVSKEHAAQLALNLGMVNQ